MPYIERKPPEKLAPYVKCIWYLNHRYNEWNHDEVLWPDGCYELIFHFGSNYRVNNEQMETSFLIGSLTRYHRLKSDGEIRLFGVRIKPWALNYFLDQAVDLKKMKDTFVPLKYLFKEEDIKLMESNLKEASLEEGIKLVNRFILDAFHPNYFTNNDFIQILADLFNRPVQVQLQDAILMSNYSQRQFERKVIELTGLSPKKLSKVARFNQVRLKLFFHPQTDLYDLMEEFGYYDYAHFSKDFKECMGLTPKEYRNWMLEKVNNSPQKAKHVDFLQDE
ncbi:AraC family transcriptional regulator [Ureibacillus sp. Re31]|uniref:AraC family transcriptional regulator n=1 Tax=Ureibacillus galli TaxID=2762222 RepID=A0ABR8XBZ7_9BACL|nr:helix-turn-helix domain-containing protein [Ureibacillus galli]MBD8026738.1 AraC family transcriptional regulator [Ureibacillus galli]